MTLERDLTTAVGAEHVLTTPELTASYGTDWTRRFSGQARAVVRPAGAAEVARVVAGCAEHGCALVPQGGNTGLVGGSVPRGSGEQVVLSTRRLTRLSPVDLAAGQVTAEAGVTLAALQTHAARAGRAYGVDLAARDSATVGGTIATNAGGIRVVRYGDTRAQVLGLQAVLADGSVIEHLGGLVKDNTGYDLAGLLTGSEGTLGVVTAARLRLWPRPGPCVVVLVGTESVQRALELLPVAGLRAAELMFSDGIDLVCGVTGLVQPTRRRWPVYLLLEIDLTEAPGGPVLPDDVEAVSDDRLWAYRERHTEAISTLGVVHKLDVAVPIERLPAFCDAVRAATAPHRTFLFGHVGDGNVHVNVVAPPADAESVDDAVLRLTASYGGSIAAEHGVGVAKVRWLGLARSPTEIAAMRRIKTALDPGGLLNPGVIFPMDAAGVAG